MPSVDDEEFGPYLAVGILRVPYHPALTFVALPPACDPSPVSRNNQVNLAAAARIFVFPACSPSATAPFVDQNVHNEGEGGRVGHDVAVNTEVHFEVEDGNVQVKCELEGLELEDGVKNEFEDGELEDVGEGEVEIGAASLSSAVEEPELDIDGDSDDGVDLAAADSGELDADDEFDGDHIMGLEEPEWHPWPAGTRGGLKSCPVVVARQTQVLIDNGYARALYMVHREEVPNQGPYPPPASLYVRLYLLPDDVKSYRILNPSKDCRKALHAVLKIVDCSPRRFASPAPYLRWPTESRLGVWKYTPPPDATLGSIYAGMPSPCPFAIDGKSNEDDIRLLRESLTLPAPRGMRSTLFGYQKRSLWKLLQRELFPQRVLNPELVECARADTGAPYWISTTTNMLYSSKTEYLDPLGGMICEGFAEMGTGKTCICLALILHTRHQISQPSADSVPKSLNEGPVRVDIDPSHLRPIHGHEPDLDPVSRPVPSLKELTATKILTDRIPHAHWEWPPTLDALLRESHPYYLKPPPYAYRLTRKGEDDQSRFLKVFVSSATLVVVPDTLVDQWRTEINKHTEDLELRVLVLTTGGAEVPPAEELLAFDMVLISHSRFGKEARVGKVRQSGVTGKNQCMCPINLTTNAVHCVCRSPLLSLRWLRLIIDEGHSMAKSEQKNSQVDIAARLECDRKWICSGTPMPNFLVEPSPAEERVDVEKLGMLLREFLRVEPYASDKDAFKNIIAKPFLEKGFRGLEKLQDVMQRIMVRNREEDIEGDIKLPPLSVSTTTLPFTPHQRLVQNCVLCMIGANAILSERTDQDYFFDSRSASALREVISNLERSSFAFCGPVTGPRLLQQSVDTLENVVEGLAEQRIGTRRFPDHDVAQLEEIKRELEAALADGEWKSLLCGYDVGYLVAGSLDEVRWGDDGSASNGVRGDGWAVWDGRDVENVRNAAKSRAVVVRVPVSGAREAGAADGGTGAAPGGVDPMDVDQTPASMASMEADPDPAPERGLDTESAPLPNSDPLILATSSAKLSYLADQIARYSREEKIIIFAQLDVELFHLHEICRILRIRCLLFHTKMAKRAHNITTFQTSQTIRVIIMQTAISAWGIDLSAASRVYFVSPVWQSDMERQAIKRAHRIGCTREVFVETLVIRDSFEEEILRRRRPLKDAGPAAKRVKTMTDDAAMREVLSRARLVPPAPPPSPTTLPPRLSTLRLSPMTLLAPLETPIPLIPPPAASLFAATDDRPAAVDPDDEKEDEDYYSRSIPTWPDTAAAEPATGSSESSIRFREDAESSARVDSPPAKRLKGAGGKRAKVSWGDAE
ncbi:SNF2 family N-terminal domain-containing protein [Blyttiomyces helicus]|uniref:SNF2 family N-terminal domain-containing protein n=1 Tax=Blyttiomyces helicus TaxID=388810 RepID=A0A4P9WAK9_9FUNG|nr:SNF2 family N-terminal domain-containing protein [Blyttiomyces helicus]|eukprot:RKO89631.1 SNF2 family N-terminal domain-containing protein [Blyttiomyces helicus]